MRARGVSRSVCAAALAAVAAAALASGCAQHSGSGGTASEGTPASAAAAPVQHTAPAGVVSPSGPIAALLAEPATGRLVLLDGDGVTVRIQDPTGGAAERSLTLPARTSALVAGPAGQVLAAAGHTVLHVDVAAATVHATAVDGQVRAVAQRPDGTEAAVLADGRLLILAADGRVLHTVEGMSGDEIAAPGTAVAVLDRARTTLTQADIAHARAGLALRTGQGATNLVTDHFGRILVTDTTGGALLVYTADPLAMHQMFPLGSAPYALAYDQRSETVWVTLTGSNQIAGFDLSTGIPVEVGRYPTVRQPNAVTVDSRTGELFVGSATGDGLQRIGADERKRGQ